MKRVKELAAKVVDREVTVLLIGETGTGKEAFARAIHFNGRRSGQRFVAANCGALSESLLESELFGHRRGSFTGATEDRIGLLEAASGGTVFLDEIGETSPAMQVKLLRVLQESEVTRVGETEPRSIDVRVIAATNRDLAGDIQAGRFREDLYYRLNVFPIRLPPLRERRDDIPLLARHFLDRFAREFGQSCPGFTSEAMDALVSCDWPGNVRELANEVQRALVLATPGERIDVSDLSDRLRGTSVRSASGRSRRGLLKTAIEDVEREMIQAAYRAHEGNRTHMAAELGISRWTLLQKMRAHGLVSESESS
jgi:transcriptional regulator with PAS, ATPase and Fis domain